MIINTRTQKPTMGTIIDFGDWGQVDYEPSKQVVEKAKSGLGKLGFDWLWGGSDETGKEAAQLIDKKTLMIGGMVLGGAVLLIVAARASAGKKRKR